MRSLWKLTALAGVIGVGVMVVVKAQQDLASRGTTPLEQFMEVAGADAAPWTPDEKAPSSTAPPAQEEPAFPSQSEPPPGSALAAGESASSDPFSFLYQGSPGGAAARTAAAPDQSEPVPFPTTNETAPHPLVAAADAKPEWNVAANQWRNDLQPLLNAAGSEPGFSASGERPPFPTGEPNTPASAPSMHDIAPVDMTLPAEHDRGIQLVAAESPAVDGDAAAPLRTFPRELDAPALLTPPSKDDSALAQAWPGPQPNVTHALLEQGPGDHRVPVPPIEPAAGTAPAPREPLPLDLFAPNPSGGSASSIPADSRTAATPPPADRTREPPPATASGDPFFFPDLSAGTSAPPSLPASPAMFPDRTRGVEDVPPFPVNEVPPAINAPEPPAPFIPPEFNSRSSIPAESPPLPPFPEFHSAPPAGNPPPADGMVPIRSRHHSSPEPTFTPDPRFEPAGHTEPALGNSGSPPPFDSPFPALPPASNEPARSSIPANPPLITPLPSRTPEAPASGLDLTGTGTIDAAVAPGPQQPELQIEKDAPPRAVLNQPLVYNIRVRNVGRTAAHQVTVEDSIPLGSTLKGTIPEAELDPQDKHLVWRLGTIEPGQEQLIRVQIVPTEAGEIGSVATVRFVGRVTSRTVITAPRLELTMLGPTEAIVGETATYRFRIANSGDGDARDVVLRNIIPAQLQHAAGNDLEYEVGHVPAGQSREVVLAVTASRAGPATNAAIVSVKGQEHDKATVDLTVIGSRLSIVRTGPERRFVDAPGNFVTQVTNQSGRPLRNVTVVEQLAPGVELAAVPEHARVDPVRRTITWLIPQLAPQQSVDLKSSLAAKERGRYACVVRAFDAANNQAEATAQLEVEGFSLLSADVSQASQHGGVVAVGDQVALRMTIQNRGSAAASDVVTEFEIPPELEFVTAQPRQYTLNGSKVRFETIPSVAANSTQTIDIVCVAKTPGRPRVAASIWSNDEPLVRQEEAVVVYRADP